MPLDTVVAPHASRALIHYWDVGPLLGGSKCGGASGANGVSRSARALGVLASACDRRKRGRRPPFIGQEHYSGTNSASFDDCGFVIDVESEFSRQGILFRVGKGGQAFLVETTSTATCSRTARQESGS